MIDCIFYKIGAGKIGASVVYQDEQVVAFRDLNPQAPTHILIIPKKHIDRLSSLKEEEFSLMGDIHRAIQLVARQEKIVESGFRVVINDGADGGQSVSHLHFHILGGRSLQWPPG